MFLLLPLSLLLSVCGCYASIEMSTAICRRFAYVSIVVSFTPAISTEQQQRQWQRQRRQQQQERITTTTVLLLTIFYSCFIYLNYLILCLNSALAFFVVVYFDYNKYQRFFCVWPKAFLQLLRAYCAASASAVAMAEATDRRFDAGSQVNVDDNLSLLTSVCWQATTTTTTAFIIFSIAHCQFWYKSNEINRYDCCQANRSIDLHFSLHNLSSLSTFCLSLSRHRLRSFNVKIYSKYFVII